MSSQLTSPICYGSSGSNSTNKGADAPRVSLTQLSTASLAASFFSELFSGPGRHDLSSVYSPRRENFSNSRSVTADALRQYVSVSTSAEFGFP